MELFTRTRTAAGLNASVERALRDAAERGWSGRLVIHDPRTGAEASVWAYEGGIYAVQVGSYAPQFMSRMISGGLLDADQLRQFSAEVPVADRDRRIGRFAVEHDWLPIDTLATLHGEYLLAGLGAALALPKARVQREAGFGTDQWCTMPAPPEELIEAVAFRTQRATQTWAGLEAVGSPRETVLQPVDPQAAVTRATPEIAAFMGLVDDQNTVDEIAGHCGFTRAEAIALTAALVNGGAAALGRRRTIAGSFVPEDFGATA